MLGFNFETSRDLAGPVEHLKRPKVSDWESSGTSGLKDGESQISVPIFYKRTQNCIVLILNWDPDPMRWLSQLHDVQCTS
jgi:hypothetical protein